MTRSTLILCAAIALGSMGIYACDSGSSGGSLATGSCDYTNEVSSEPECKEYSGSAWTPTSAKASCVNGLATDALPGTWSASAECALAPSFGKCSVPDSLGESMEYVLEIGGSDPLDPLECVTVADACRDHPLDGTFIPSGFCIAGICNYIVEVPPLVVGDESTFEPECKEYSGIAWTPMSAAESCGAMPTLGTWLQNTECALAPTLGTCSVPDFSGGDMEYVLAIGGSDPLDCDTAMHACVGTFTPSSICVSP